MMRSSFVSGPTTGRCIAMLLTSAMTMTTTLALSSISTSAAAAKIDVPGNLAVPGLKNGMDYCKLGDSDLVVSKVCMGTMTYGEQNTIDEGVALLNEAWEKYGCNFLDTAEIYPVPTKAETQGSTDESVRKFLEQDHINREDVVLATKVAGRSSRLNWLPRPTTDPDGETGCFLSKEQIFESVDESLKRLGVEYIDLLQIHWPDRYTGGAFGSPDFTPAEYEKALSDTPDQKFVPFEEQLSAFQTLIEQGKVRYIGVSNETPYGVCSMVALAKHFPDLYPKIVSIQNSYSLVVRKDYEAGLAETCYQHDVGLLPYSPLAGGTLSGKYRQEATRKNARMNMFPGFMERYLQSQNEEAVNAYCDLAAKNDMSPTTLALSWCYHNPLVASTIIGATTMEQLDEDFEAYDTKLSDDIQQEIQDIYKKYTDPTKARNNAQ
mmetsp:Transcript_13163/g.32119  ORF Transcript_13163/g.32119 Transcript_13163/m.32119 type:complete len:435 (-) Transcript_13163:95-1399(-)